MFFHGVTEEMYNNLAEDIAQFDTNTGKRKISGAKPSVKQPKITEYTKKDKERSTTPAAATTNQQRKRSSTSAGLGPRQPTIEGAFDIALSNGPSLKDPNDPKYHSSSDSGEYDLPPRPGNKKYDC